MPQRTSARGFLPTLLLVSLVSGACGAEEPVPPSTPRSAPAAARQPASLALRHAPQGLAEESTALEGMSMAALLPARPIEVPASIREALKRLAPQDDQMGGELLATEVAASLTSILGEVLAGREPAGDLLARPAAEIAGLALDYPGRRGGSAPEVTVEITAYQVSGDEAFSATGHVALVRRPGPAAAGATADIACLAPGAAWGEHVGAFQLTLEFDSRWLQVAGHLRLEELVCRVPSTPVLAPIAAASLFEEHSRAAFGSDPGFVEELLRGPDAYYFHSDRLSGYDLVCNHGLAVGDIDGDGWEDIYVCMPPGLPNRLFLRNAQGGTREAALEFNVAYLDSTRSALILDLDGDGHRDLAAALGGDVLLHWNDGQTLGAAPPLRPATPEDIFSLAAADFDLDGDLDLYACRYSSQGVMQGNPTPYHDARNGSPNILWRNEGGRKFSDATAEVGLDQGNTRYSFSALWEDFDDDGDPDLYVVNDFGRNHYWRNEGGHFSDVADAVGAADMAAGMGVSAGDVDSDGHLDLYVSNMYSAEGLRSVSQREQFLRGRPAEMLDVYRRHARGNTLLVNRGDGSWDDQSEASGSSRAGWAWGAQLFDADNDGDLDIYSPNGFLTRRVPETADEFFWRYVIARSPVDATLTAEYHDAWYSMQYLYSELGQGWNGEESNVFFLGDGRGNFRDASGISGADYLDDARSMSVLDWDRDGFLDLLLKNRSAPRLRLLRNRGTQAARAAWLLVELVGTAPNMDAVGARVRVLTERGTLRRSVTAGDGFLSQTTNRLHFGLGSNEPVRALEVRWPDGQEQRFEGPFEAGRALRIRRGAARPEPLAWDPIPGFAVRAPQPLVQLEGIAGRTVLFDKLPLSPLTLPPFGGGDRRVSHFAGRPLLVTLWRGADPPSEGQLARFARDIERIDASGLQLVTLAVDSGAALAGARRTCEALGLGESGGYADGWTLQALEILLLEVYHRGETNPLPTSLLIDRAGQLCVVYQGPLRVNTLLEDLAVLKQMDPRLGTCARLQRGRWFARPRRDMAKLGGVFTGLGYQDFAAFYTELAKR